MIAYLSTIAALTAGAYVLIMRELRQESAQPLILPGPAGLDRPNRAGEAPVVVRAAWYDTTVQGWGRIARRQQAGWRAQSAITGARAGHEAFRLLVLAAAVHARCAEPIAHLDRTWGDDTGSFKAFCEATA